MVPEWYIDWQNSDLSYKEIPICIGHLGYVHVEMVKKKLYCLDTGCAGGEKLTALVLPEKKIVQVKSKKNYKKDAYKQFWQTLKVNDFAIKEYKTLKNSNDDLQSFIKQFVEKCNNFLNELFAEEKLLKIKDKLIQKFGSYPVDNNLKKDYTINLKAQIPNKVHSLSLLLIKKDFNEDDSLKTELLKKYIKKTFGCLESDFKKLEEYWI